MGTNTLLTSSLVTKTALAMFLNKLSFLTTANKAVEADFRNPEYQAGDSIQIRQRVRFKGGDGQVANSEPIIEPAEILTLDHQPHIMFDYSTRDLTLKMDEFRERYLESAVNRLVTKVETIIAQKAALDLNFFVGTPGTYFNSFKSVDLVGAKLLSMGVDIDEAYFVQSLRDSVETKSSFLNSFTPVLNDNIAKKSALGHISYFDMFQSANVAKQIAGTPGAGPITVSMTVSSGNAIPMTGLASGQTVFRKGDRFSVAGVQNVNPLNYTGTGDDMQFVVTADVESDLSGNAVVPVNPSIVINGPRQNVTNAIASGSVVTPLGSHNVNVAYPKGGFSLAMPPLKKLSVPFSSVETRYGVALRVQAQGDIKNDVDEMRIDCLVGVKWHNEYCVIGVS